MIQQTLSLRSLISLLQQLLESCDSFYLAADLPKLVKGCATNLKGFEDILVKLSPPAGNKSTKMWRHVKVLLGSKDLDRMAALIQQDLAVLSLQMQIIERYTASSPPKILKLSIDLL